MTTPAAQLAGFIAKFSPAIASDARAALLRLRRLLPTAAVRLVYETTTVSSSASAQTTARPTRSELLHFTAVTELETALADNRAAVDEFVGTARGLEATAWTASRDGRWSSGQVVEHLARAYEYNRAVIRGTADGLPFPLTLLKPLIRRMVVTNTLKAGRFTRKGKAPKPFQPGPTPAPQPELVARLTAAVTGFEADLRSRPRSDTIDHPVFGTISTTDWVTLQAIHARHHRAQLTSLTSGPD